MIDWDDLPECGWIRTPYGQLGFSKDEVELTLLEPDFLGRTEITVQAVTPRKMFQRSVRFPLPIKITNYNKAIEIIEIWVSKPLAEIKWESA
jgi:hypothetical protein